MGNEGEAKMPSPCIPEASRTCLNRCCTPPFLHSQKPQNFLSESATAHLNDFVSATFSSLPNPNAHFTNHESLPRLGESFSAFENSYPQFSQTKQADQVRARDYPHLSLSDHVCLDYIGHGLFTTTTPSIASSSSSPYPPLDSNPFFDVVYKSVILDSQVLDSIEESEFESKIRKRIFRFMNVSEDDYSMVFTANKSSAFKLLAETYPFHSHRILLTVYDHESQAVETMIENAAQRGASIKSAEFSWPNLRIQSKKLRNLVENKRNKKNRGLFVFPLQSSLTGARYSYLRMSLARENGWNVLLDASALGAKDMETLGLSLFQPDFLFCSFYKVFGENPSGCGCLFIKKSTASVLNKSRIGIVSLVPAQKPKFELPKQDLAELSDESSEILENEVPTRKHKEKELSLSEFVPELEFRGLDNADSLGLILISNRAKYLVNWLVNALLSLKHPHSENGYFLVHIYGPKIQIDRGPAIAFNVFDWKGETIDPELVQKLADRNNISLSCGFLQHIRFSDKYGEEKERLLETRTNKRNGNLNSGIYVLNATLGFLTNFEDIYRLWAFVSRFLDADFVEKEKWRYMALNQKTVEV